MTRAEIFERLGERQMPMFARTKSLAILMECHPRTVKRWWQRLGVPPDIVGHGANRWNWRNAHKLIARWRKYRAKHRAAAGWRNGKKFPS